jgi:hypothetical protein
MSVASDIWQRSGARARPPPAWRARPRYPPDIAVDGKSAYNLGWFVPTTRPARDPGPAPPPTDRLHTLEQTIYATTSLPWRQARADLIAVAIRGHWRIEALHGIRDVSLGEDLAQIRTGSGPAVMATLRNVAVSRHPLFGDSPRWAADYVWVGPGEPVGALPPTGRDTPPGGRPASVDRVGDRDRILCGRVGISRALEGATPRGSRRGWRRAGRAVAVFPRRHRRVLSRRCRRRLPVAR